MGRSCVPSAGGRQGGGARLGRPLGRRALRRAGPRRRPVAGAAGPRGVRPGPDAGRGRLPAVARRARRPRRADPVAAGARRRHPHQGPRRAAVLQAPARRRRRGRGQPGPAPPAAQQLRLRPPDDDRPHRPGSGRRPARRDRAPGTAHRARGVDRAGRPPAHRPDPLAGPGRAAGVPQAPQRQPAQHRAAPLRVLLHAAVVAAARRADLRGPARALPAAAGGGARGRAGAAHPGCRGGGRRGRAGALLALRGRDQPLSLGGRPVRGDPRELQLPHAQPGP